MSDAIAKVLLIGYGNPGRLDDGLGPAVADAIEKLELDGVTVDADYQLVLEDAAAIAQHDVVIFADADTETAGSFYFKALEPDASLGFSSHSVQPAAALGLAHDLFGAKTKGYLLGIRGYAFNEFEESMTPQAKENLAAALTFIESVLRKRNFAEAITVPDESAAPGLASVNEVVTCKTEST